MKIHEIGLGSITSRCSGNEPALTPEESLLTEEIIEYRATYLHLIAYEYNLLCYGSFVQNMPTNENEVDQSGPVFYSCSQEGNAFNNS